VYQELTKIIPPPSEALGLQMRKVVAHWVVHNALGRFEKQNIAEAAVVVPDEFVELDLSTGLSNDQCHGHIGSHVMQPMEHSDTTLQHNNHVVLQQKNRV
jgi:hypothetical protein